MVWHVRGAGQFEMPAVTFDGTQSLWTSSLGAADAMALTCSYWFKPPPFSAPNPIGVWAMDVDLDVNDPQYFRPWDQLIGGTGWQPSIGWQYSTEEGHAAFGAGATGSNPVVISSGIWHHILYAFDMTTGTSVYYLDDVLESSTEYLYPDPEDPNLLPLPGLPIPGSKSFFLGQLLEPNGNYYLRGDIAEFWFGFGQDVRQGGVIAEETRRKFVTSDGRPVPLGENGEGPTGTSPVIFGHGNRRTFLQPNLGSGGDFTLIGELTDAGTRPRVGV